VTELRAGIIVGPGSAAFEVMRDLVFHLPVMITPRWVQSKSPPIALDNLLMYLVRLPQIPAAQGRVFDAGGPETLTYAQMMRILAEEGGRRPPLIIPVPVLTPRLSSYWLRLITSVPTNIARALIEGLKHDFTADDAELRRLVPQHLLGFRDAVAAVFAAERESAPVVARWTEGAFAVRQQRIDYAYYAKRAGGSAETTAPPSAVWEVLYLEPERRLSLAFGMKAPGAGILEFELTPRADGGTRLSVAAYWHPAGVWGLLYWYAFEPMHKVLFAGTAREICRRAERSPIRDPAASRRA
jgi:hypothetical protein